MANCYKRTGYETIAYLSVSVEKNVPLRYDACFPVNTENCFVRSHDPGSLALSQLSRPQMTGQPFLFLVTVVQMLLIHITLLLIPAIVNTFIICNKSMLRFLFHKKTWKQSLPRCDSLDPRGFRNTLSWKQQIFLCCKDL